MYTTELVVNANFKNELLKLARKVGVKTRKLYAGELVIRNEVITRYQYRVSGSKSSVYDFAEQAERMFDALEGGNYDEYYFYCLEITDYVNEREARFEAERLAAQIAAHEAAVKAAKAQEAEWRKAQLARLASA